MKRFVVCLAFGLIGISAVPAGAQAADWKSCGATASADRPETFVWSHRGECVKAVAVVRSFYKQLDSFPELEGFPQGSTSMNVGRFDCSLTYAPDSFRLRCESSPVVILGLDRADSDPNEWKRPPAVTRTLTRSKAVAMMTGGIKMDDLGHGRKEQLDVTCPVRLSRLSFRCRYSWFEGPYHFRGNGRITKELNGSSTRFRTHAYDRACLKDGGTLRKCDLED